MIELLTFIFAAVTSYFGVAWFARWSVKRELLDIPNHRSSHDVPTPRGGGLVIVVVCLTVYVATSYSLTDQFSWSYLIGAVLVASISWLDDVRSVSFVLRFLIHSVAAGLVLFELGYWNHFDLPLISQSLYLGTAGIAVTFLWIVWVINAYNFMDGIDGIAGVQAVAASAGWFVIAIWLGDVQISLFALSLAAATLGFLVHNWHPAKIFMGDVGSAFLGFTFAVLPLLIARGTSTAVNYIPLVSALFLWPFLFDTILTFVRRALQGQRVWTAHREHLYQRMVRSGFKHHIVSKIYGLSAAFIVVMTLFAMFFGGFLRFALAIVTFLVTVFIFIASNSKKRLT